MSMSLASVVQLESTDGPLYVISFGQIHGSYYMPHL
jgi:hypothetical protein